MEIRKDVWHYRLYQFGRFSDEKDSRGSVLKKTVTLCSYVRTMVLGSILKVVLGALVLIAVVSYAAGMSLVAIVSGVGYPSLKRFRNHKNLDDDEEPLIAGFKPLTIGGRTFKVASLLWSLYGLIAATALIGSYHSAMIRAAHFCLAHAAQIGLGALVLAAIFVIYVILGKGFAALGEGWKLFWAWAKAKKEGVCPVITFVEPPTTAS